MRRELDAMSRRHPGHKKIVLIGHSMGGLISRMMITDSGTKLWDACLPRAQGQHTVPAESRAALSEALIFRHRPEVSRVIYVSTPHRGSTAASGWMGRIGTHLVKTPGILAGNAAALESTVIPNSIETLSPENPFVKALSETPMVPGVPHHSIMGDRGLGGNPGRTGRVRTDGFVPYWSSHIDSARSELIVPSRHSAHQHEKAIAEIRRILLEHARR
jgi:pimeloyl-ACP methyl ester carboxylesterase